MLSGRQVVLEVRKHHNIGRITCELTRELGLLWDRVVLMLNDEVMRADRRLQDCGIRDETTAQGAVVPFPIEPLCPVNMPPNVDFLLTCSVMTRGPVELHVRRHHNIGNIVGQVEWALGWPPDTVELVYNDEVMRMELRLQDYGIHGETTVWVVARSS
jgi:hypothetical protein